jgi:hypothetical protein
MLITSDLDYLVCIIFSSYADVGLINFAAVVNQAQYDTAKDVILDLLGWGVEPEFLLTCGLSRHIIFYVFSELNLRLPMNFDTSGLIPYYPMARSTISTPTTNLPYRPLADSTMMPPPSSRPEASPISPSRAFFGHPSLPPKPTPTSKAPLQKQASGAQPSPLQVNTSISLTNVANEQPPPTSTTPTTNLHDIEQQRKQELLARKAVIASRKAKQAAGNTAAPTPTSSISPQAKDQDVDMASLIPDETVDDFLKTIGPTSDVGGTGAKHATDGIAESTSKGEQSRSMSMEVDESIPGLNSSSANGDDSSGRSYTSATQASTSTTVLGTDMVSSPTSNSAPPSSADSGIEPPPSGSSADAGLSHQARGNDLIMNIAPPQLLRRGTKRPVAADFVDLEPIRGSNGHGYTNGGSSAHPNHLTRRKMVVAAAFAGVSGMRRCVIDLSDSEDDGEGEPMVLDYGSGEYERGWGRASPAPRIASSISTPVGAGSAYGTPPPHINGGVAVGASVRSPAVLMEKEQEIAKMRELIKQREQVRRKKLAVSLKQIITLRWTHWMLF